MCLWLQQKKKNPRIYNIRYKIILSKNTQTKFKIIYCKYFLKNKKKTLFRQWKEASSTRIPTYFSPYKPTQSIPNCSRRPYTSFSLSLSFLGTQRQKARRIVAARVCKRSVEASSHSRIERIRSRGWCKGCRSLRGIIHAISPQAAQWARHLDNKQRRHNYSIPPLRVVVGVEFRSFAPLHPFPSLIQLEPRIQEVSFVGGTFQGASVGSSHASLTAFHPRSIEPWLPMTEFRENRVKGRGIVVSLVIFGNIRWM